MTTRKHTWEAKGGVRLYRGWYIWRDAGWHAQEAAGAFHVNSFATACDHIDSIVDNNTERSEPAVNEIAPKE